MAMEHPDLFAACLLVSGQLDPEKCDALAGKKLWIVVSEDDQRAFPGMNALTEYLKTAFGLPENVEPLCIVPIGVPAGEDQPKDTTPFTRAPGQGL